MSIDSYNKEKRNIIINRKKCRTDKTVRYKFANKICFRPIKINKSLSI